jgi:hypothetical protein
VAGRPPSPLARVGTVEGPHRATTGANYADGAGAAPLSSLITHHSPLTTLHCPLSTIHSPLTSHRRSPRRCG